VALLGAKVVERIGDRACVVLHDRVSVVLHLLQPLPAALDGRYLPLGRLTVHLQPRQLGPQLDSVHDPLGGEVQVTAPLSTKGGEPL